MATSFHASYAELKQNKPNKKAVLCQICQTQGRETWSTPKNPLNASARVQRCC